PKINGWGELFGLTWKSDDFLVSVLPDAESVLRQLPVWLAHYNDLHPHRALGYRSPREFITRSTQETLSGF
ncbi:integrase, partial [Methylobacterium radiotolerans]